MWLVCKHIVQRIYDGKYGIREVVIQSLRKGTQLLYKAQHQSRARKIYSVNYKIYIY
jgi:hypothetical protein